MGIVIVALVAGLLVVPTTAQVAQADSNCPTAANSYAGGAGIASDPWQISTKEEFQRLRDDSVTGWDDSFVLTANINMGGCTWTSVIGDSSANKFTGMIDGDGHVISGLNVDIPSRSGEVYAGLIGYLGPSGIITELGFTGSVNVVGSGSFSSVFAGGLVGRVITGSSISFSFASGNVSATLGSFVSGYAGGLVGNVNGGAISNSYATGTAFVNTAGYPPSIGGLVGSAASSPSVSVKKSYSSGYLLVVGGASSTNVGGFLGSGGGGGSDLSDNFWDTTTSGTSTGVGGGGGPVTGITGKTTTEMQTLSTYTNWDISGSWVPFSLPGNVWGICAGVNRAYLLWQYAASPCPTTPSAPSITSIIPGGTTASVAFTVDDTGNAPITQLQFWYDDTIGGPDVTIGGGTSPAMLTGLALGTTYTVYMKVKNSTYTGPWSAPQTFTTLRRPGAPTITGVTPSLNSAQVAFTVDDSGGSPLTRLEFALDDTTTVDDSTVVVTSPYALSGLASGTAYVVYMRAVNAQGTGSWSAASAFTTLAPPPPPTPRPPRPIPIPASPPTVVVATAGDASVFVTWTPPASTGSYPITQYRAVASPGNQMCVTATTSCAITGLTNGTAYTVRVEAFTEAGWSESSVPSNAVTPQAPAVKSLSITASRGIGAERRIITVRGVSSGLAGQAVTIWLAFAGEKPRPAMVRAMIQEDGTFTWSRRSTRAITIFAEAGGVRSQTVKVRAI